MIFKRLDPAIGRTGHAGAVESGPAMAGVVESGVVESGTVEATTVTVVHAPACHFCDDAEQALTRLAETYPVIIDRVDIHSERGRQLVARHRPAMNPLVLVDGEFFGFGRLSRGRLRTLLERRTAGRGAAS